jgi:hypothetical protein
MTPSPFVSSILAARTATEDFFSQFREAVDIVFLQCKTNVGDAAGCKECVLAVLTGRESQQLLGTGCDVPLRSTPRTQWRSSRLFITSYVYSHQVLTAPISASEDLGIDDRLAG